MNCCGSQGTWQFNFILLSIFDNLRLLNWHLWFQMASNSVNSTTQNLHTEGLNDEDWSNLFCARDEDEEEYIPANESSDSDSDLEPMDIHSQPPSGFAY